jgi:alpha-1,2-mannosyltransferase
MPFSAWQEDQRVRRAIYVLVALELGLVIGFAAVYQPFDLNIYLWGGHAVLHGMRLYLVLAHANWFTYPPFAALIFTPLTATPTFIVRMCWELASVGAIGWACVNTVKLAGYRPTRILILAMVAAAFLLEPMYHTLYLGQVNLFLLAVVLADISRVSRGRPAGVGIGIAAAIKLVPAVFIVLLLLTRRTRDAVIAAATFTCCGAIGYLVDPGASRLYWTRLFDDTRRVSATYISNQSPYAAVTRILGGVGHVGGWYVIISLCLGLSGLAIAAVQAARNDWLGATAVTGTTGLLVSPISWTHHWVWILPALVVLLRGGIRARIAAGFTFALFVVAPMWWTPHPGGPGQFGWHWLATLIANCFLIAGLAFIAYMTWLTVCWEDADQSDRPAELVVASQI